MRVAAEIDYQVSPGDDLDVIVADMKGRLALMVDAIGGKADVKLMIDMESK